MSVRVFRVQDADGRDPWKPGFSMHWVDFDKAPPPAPFYEEFPDIDLQKELRNGHLGCGCRSLSQIGLWFNRKELATLAQLGYGIVQVRADKVIAESKNQLVFWRKTPLNIGAIILPFGQSVLLA